MPRDDVDTFAMDVGDGYQLLCDGSFTVTITAPAGMTIRLEVLDGDEVVDEATSADGITGHGDAAATRLPLLRRPHAHRPGVADRHRSHGRHVPLDRPAASDPSGRSGSSGRGRHEARLGSAAMGMERAGVTFASLMSLGPAAAVETA